MLEEHINKYDKEYEAFQIFEQIQFQETEVVQEPSESMTEASGFQTVSSISQEDDPYYEIEYDSIPLQESSGEKIAFEETFIRQPDRIETPPRDEVRELFNQMRDIARENRYLNFSRPKFYDKRTQQENSRIFYKQGMFMKDFEDEYEKSVSYSAYFPNYQMMGYEQLRTYFTWRTKVRQGNVTHLSLSYAFLYLYELLNNIGVENPEDGLDRLLFFWEAFRVYDPSVDKYVPKWLKDYYIYYGLEGAFQVFIQQNGLESYYPGMTEEEDDFDLLCSISKYNIRESAFYSEERKELIQRCFIFTIDRLKETFEKSGIDFDEFLFCPTKNMTTWDPFQGALFYPSLKQPDRRVVLSEKEIYMCSQNHWTFSKVITAESGRRLIGYVMKRMEEVLRRLTKYKYKLSASLNLLSPVMADELNKAGIHLEKLVEDSVKAFYREETRTVVKVNPNALEKIRQEALITQEKLVVLDEEPVAVSLKVQDKVTDTMAEKLAMAEELAVVVEPVMIENIAIAEDIGMSESSGTEQTTYATKERSASERSSASGKLIVPETPAMPENAAGQGACFPKEVSPIPDNSTRGKDFRETVSAVPENDSTREAHVPEAETLDMPWIELKNALTGTEKEALALVLGGETNLKPFADRHGIMLEILAEGINEKSMDFIGDSLLDEEFLIYEDYVELVKGMVESI